MKFTKKISELINRELGRYHTLTPEEIEAGKVVIKMERFGSVKIKEISRNRLGHLSVTCHFEGDSYLFQNGIYQKADTAFIKAIRYF